MVKEQRAFGKHVLETLTVGMYSDNRIIFREYIQNAADAIDQAVAMEILNNRDDCEIKITIDNEKREIKIRDNGIGIPTKEVYHRLGDIGKSQKIHSENRGFRGIAHLIGSVYCKELQFITSYQGEDCKTITFLDGMELRRLLQPNEAQEMDAVDVIDAVTVLDDTQPENKDEHYFEVILTDILEGHENLLDIDDVQAYLSQVAPVPFNCQKLSALKKVNEKLVELGKEQEEFNIYLYDNKGESEQIYKPYQFSVRISDKKGEDNTDLIKCIEFFEGYKDDSSLLFLGWYSITDLRGMIKDHKVNGLRVRKGNIQIGNNRTLDSFFGSESNRRFNRWFVGEIYVFDDNLLPNGRRDDFEQNDAFFKFKKEVEKTTIKKLVKLPYDSSKARSSEKRIRESTEEIKEIKQEIASGVTDARKEQLLDKKNDIEKKIKGITTPKAKARSAISVEKVEVTKPVVSTKPKTRFNGSVKETAGTKKTTIIIEEPSPKVNNIQETKNVLLDQVQELERDIQTNKKRPTDELPSSIPRECRKKIGIIFEVIDRRSPDEGWANELKKHIIAELQPKGGKKR